MGIALLAFMDLLTPLQSLASRWITVRRDQNLGATGLRYVAVRPTAGACAVSRRLPAASASSARPLRVVRVIDKQATGARTGRVVISGRMSDVCAELDRLAALEAAELSPSLGKHQLH